VAAQDDSEQRLWGMPTVVVIRATNVNEGPEFSGVAAAGESNAGFIVRFVGRNTPTGQDIGSPILATDPEDTTVTYTKQSGDAGNLFVVQSATG